MTPAFPSKRDWSTFPKIHFSYNFSKNLSNQNLQEHWATLELLKTLHEIITSLGSLSRKLQLYSYSKKCILRNFANYNFCWRLSFQPLEDDWATSVVFNRMSGINIVNLWRISKIIFCEILHFTTFVEYLISFGSTQYTKWNQYSESVAHVHCS